MFFSRRNSMMEEEPDKYEEILARANKVGADYGIKFELNRENNTYSFLINCINQKEEGYHTHFFMTNPYKETSTFVSVFMSPLDYHFNKPTLELCDAINDLNSNYPFFQFYLEEEDDGVSLNLGYAFPKDCIEHIEAVLQELLDTYFEVLNSKEFALIISLADENN